MTFFTDTPFKMLIVTSFVAAINLNTFSIFIELLILGGTKAVLFSIPSFLFVHHTIPVALLHEDTLFTGFSILHKMQSLAPIRWITLAGISMMWPGSFWTSFLRINKGNIWEVLSIPTA
jgi:hypothetical protein